MRSHGYWISPPSYFLILKSIGWISAPGLRDAPWKVPHYEPFRPNQIWGEDWTILTIVELRQYLLTIIDYFSLYIVAWGIVKTVTYREIRDLVALACIGERIEHQDRRPILRTDQGSPNMACNTKKADQRHRDMVLSPSRAYRPTDNSRQERWYRRVKQEEIYCYPIYPSVSRDRPVLCIPLYKTLIEFLNMSSQVQHSQIRAFTKS